MTFSFDSLHRRYKRLLENSEKICKIKNASGIILLAALVLIFGSASLYKNIELPIDFPILILLSFLPMGFVVYLLNYSNRFVMKNDDYRFFKIYDTYIKLQTYQDTKLQDDKSKAIASVIYLADMIGGWTKNAPREISELPDSVCKNLKSKLVPAIQHDKPEIISSFINRLFNVLIGLSNSDVKISYLQAIDDDLKSYPALAIKEEAPKEPITLKIWKIKYVLIFSGSVPVFVVSQVLQEIQAGQIMEKTLLFALALIGVVVTLYAVERKVGGKSPTTKPNETSS